ncbi:uncharacterized protein LOC125020166 [Mugil cephalus]|uniref:uncharacterized protein LOC125020166 n=1 Tax=Mugil cephalus TaxID=48193 RepID=UPI001FB78BA5|nr:uncharacterized protein LOC125020166 [Mugil cephalus]
MPPVTRKAKKEFLKEEEFEIFRRNASMLIEKMVELSCQTPKDSTVLVDEALHSIFFLGGINNPPCPPEVIITDMEILNSLKESYPKPFELYSIQLPKRHPFSCVLDMIVQVTGREKENGIKEKLKELIRQLKQDARSKILYSFTICVSYIDIPDPVKYYGVSMSTTGRTAGKIMVGASCLSAWDDDVAGAVMTYNPDKSKKKYFDGTIILPDSVRCESFKLDSGEKMNPCRSCGNLFGLQTDENTDEWPYGNCAEAESVSELLKSEHQVKEQVRARHRSDENRQKARNAVLKQLKSELENTDFKWDNNFYTPQRITY